MITIIAVCVCVYVCEREREGERERERESGGKKRKRDRRGWGVIYSIIHYHIMHARSGESSALLCIHYLWWLLGQPLETIVVPTIIGYIGSLWKMVCFVANCRCV